MTDRFTERLSYRGDLAPVVARACAAYGVGEPSGVTVIETGFEDCNLIVRTDRGAYVAKFFSKTRAEGGIEPGARVREIERYGRIMDAVEHSSVRHPKLYRADGDLIFADEPSGLFLVLMDFVEGTTFAELDRPLTRLEEQDVLEQAALINALELDPPFIFDSWAATNIHDAYAAIADTLEARDRGLVQVAIERYEAIPTEELPRCFIHGDLIGSNLIRAETGEAYVLDFSVANTAPRIQELAVIASSLLHDDPTPLRERCARIAAGYERFSELIDLEKSSLEDYAIATMAMELIGAVREASRGTVTAEERAYFLAIGRGGLERALRSR